MVFGNLEIVKDDGAGFEILGLASENALAETIQDLSPCLQLWNVNIGIAWSALLWRVLNRWLLGGWHELWRLVKRIREKNFNEYYFVCFVKGFISRNVSEQS